MNRRDFLKVSGTTTILTSLPSFAGAAPSLPSRLIPEDKGISPATLAAWKQRGPQRIYRGPSLFALGMPCGGIAAGQLYLLGDGTLGDWHVDGRLNATGYGSDSYKVRAHPRQLTQGFTLLINGNDPKAPIEARLASADNGGSFANIEFIGEYPVAEIRYGQPTSARLPVNITLRAGSPFIPLNAKDSCLPCTILRFTLTNTTDKAVAGSLVGFLENGIDKPAPGEIAPLRRNRTTKLDGLSAVVMEMLPQADVESPREDRVLFDFEGETYEGWQVKGTAFGKGPARGKTPGQNPVSGFEGKGLVNTYADNDDLIGEITSAPFTIDRHHLTFLIGGGELPRRACVNLLVDGKVVRTATGHNNERLEPRAWDLRDLKDKQATLQILDAAKGPWGHINADHFVLSDRVPQAAKRPQPDSLTFGTLALAAKGSAIADIGSPDSLAKLDLAQASAKSPADSNASRPLIGAVNVPFSLAPHESKELVFILAWHFPNLHTGQGVMYSNWFKDSAQVISYVATNLDRLIKDTDLFRKTWYDDTTLPHWLADRLFMPTANLATGTAQWWKNGRFWGWEGVGCCEGTCTHVWNYSHAEARLFPELARSTRVMQDLGSGFEEATGKVAFRGEIAHGNYAGDGQSGTVLKCYREHLCSEGDSFLKANWPRIKQTLEYQIGRDAMVRGRDAKSTEPDGIIEVTQHNTYDINFEGANTFVGSLYLASLLAGAQMADLMGDKASAARYRAIAAKGRAFSEKNLFSSAPGGGGGGGGGYFIQRIPGDSLDRFQYGDGCLTDQLFGQNWARCLNLGTLYDQRMVTSALRSVYKFNFAPAVAPYSAKFPPERWFAQGKDGGLFICTWPRGNRPGEPVRYRDEVWTGCEYQAAAGMIWEGLLDEALAIIHAIDDRYDGTTHNPWNEVECGDHYARAMASYGAFQALCAFEYDGPAGLIGIAPNLHPESFKAFFSSAQGWGLASQARTRVTQVNQFDLRWGTLRLTTITAQLEKEQPPGSVKVEVKHDSKTIIATLTHEGRSARVRLAAPLVLKKDESIEVTFRF